MKHRFQFCLLSIIVCIFLMVSYISISAHAKAIYDDEEKVFVNEDDEPWRVYREKELINTQNDVIDFSHPECYEDLCTRIDKGIWKCNEIGWWYEYKDGTYEKWMFRNLDGCTYFFHKDGYMAHDEYIFGNWMSSDGSLDENYSCGIWSSNLLGYFYRDGNWRPKNQWLKIDGYWYFFKPTGYMAHDEWIDDYYVNSDGVWVYSR